MFGRLLCRIGLHRWQFEDDNDPQGGIYITSARCRRGCWRYECWRIVNIDRRVGHPAPSPPPSAAGLRPTGSP